MSILSDVYNKKVHFCRDNYREPDRLIISHDRYNELRGELTVMRYYQYHEGFETFMGMKVIPTSVQIEGGFEVR